MRFFKRKRRLPEIDRHLADEIARSGLFDPDYYALKYPDVGDFPGGALYHFLRHGLEEGRDPSPQFSVASFIRRYPNAVGGQEPPFLHALRNLDRAQRHLWLPDDDFGFKYLLEQSGLFDAAWYLRRYRDLIAWKGDPISHFIKVGAYEFRDPGPNFDTGYYRRQHRSYSDYCRTPIEHYLMLGHLEGSATKGPPKYVEWVERFDVLSAEDIARISDDLERAGCPIWGVHVLDALAAAQFERVVRAWRGMMSICAVTFVRGTGLADADWRRCSDMINETPHLTTGNIQDAFAAVPNGGVALLCSGAVLLRPHAGYVFERSLFHEDAIAAYADHDHVDGADRRSRPIFKPAMSSTFMRQLPYAGQAVAVRVGPENRATLLAAVAVAVEGETSLSWATVLLDLEASKVARIPFLLYSLPGSYEDPFPPRYEPTGPGRIAETSISEHSAAQAERGWTRVTIIIPSRDKRELLSACIDSIETQTIYPRDSYTIMVVDNGSVCEDALAYLINLNDQPGCTVIRSLGNFNFSKLCNDGAAAATGHVLVFLNNDTTVKSRDWLNKLVAEAERPGTGLVGAQLLYPDGTVQHGGTVVGVRGVAAHRLVGMDGSEAASLDVTREMLAMTGACLAVRKTVFHALSGFDEKLKVSFNDVDLCIRSYLEGYKNIYLGEALLYHHESKSRGFDDLPNKRARSFREAIHVRERYPTVFRNDPSYSPNLSIDELGALAHPPRVIRPWRLSRSGNKRVLLLSIAHGLGQGVATVVALQAEHLRKQGWEVIVGGPPSKRELRYPDCRRAYVWDAEEAAALAVEEGVDAIVAHTMPFFSVVRYLGPRPLVYFHDHGEPTPRLFPDYLARDAANWEKRLCAPMAKRVFTISQAIYNEQFRRDAIVIRNGNTHLSHWSKVLSERRSDLRKSLGFEGCFVVLNACRFGEGERHYKGIDRYAALAMDMPLLVPKLARPVMFVLAGRGDDADVAYAEAAGLQVFANVTDSAMIDLYAAADLYMSLSEWEGYNLGIGQARALGLDVLASDIPAHREFGIETASSLVELADAVARRVDTWEENNAIRECVRESWDEPLQRISEILEEDRRRVTASVWF